MKKWKYTIRSVDTLPDSAGTDIEKLMNDMGNKGWELASTIDRSYLVTHEVIFIFKTPKE